MTAKEELLQIRKLDKMLKATEQEISECRADIYALQATDYSKERVSGGVAADIGDKVEVLMRLEDKASREWHALMNERIRIRTKIDRIENLELRSVLIQYYVMQHTLEQIAVDMGYTWRHMQRKLNKGLIAYGEANAKMS